MLRNACTVRHALVCDSSDRAQRGKGMGKEKIKKHRTEREDAAAGAAALSRSVAAASLSDGLWIEIVGRRGRVLVFFGEEIVVRER